MGWLFVVMSIIFFLGTIAEKDRNKAEFYLMGLAVTGTLSILMRVL